MIVEKKYLDQSNEFLSFKKEKKILAALALFCKDNTFKVISYESQPPKSVIVCGQSVPKKCAKLGTISVTFEDTNLL